MVWQCFMKNLFGYEEERVMWMYKWVPMKEKRNNETNSEQSTWMFSDEKLEVGGAEVELPLEFFKGESSSEGWQASVLMKQGCMKDRDQERKMPEEQQTAQSNQWNL